MGQMGEPEKVANAALWLASDASRYVTGQSLNVVAEAWPVKREQGKKEHHSKRAFERCNKCDHMFWEEAQVNLIMGCSSIIEDIWHTHLQQNTGPPMIMGGLAEQG